MPLKVIPCSPLFYMLSSLLCWFFPLPWTVSGRLPAHPLPVCSTSRAQLHLPRAAGSQIPLFLVIAKVTLPWKLCFSYLSKKKYEISYNRIISKIASLPQCYYLSFLSVSLSTVLSNTNLEQNLC